MALLAPAQYVIDRSFMEPGLLMPYSQSSGWTECLADGQPLPRLGLDDLAVYMRRIDLRTKTAAGQSAYNSLPSVSIALSNISTPTYLLRVRAEYDHHDTATAGRYGVSIAEAYRLGMRQGMFSLARSAGLYGFNPASGEGILNTPGATAVTLPPDSNGNLTIQTYDNGQMAQFLLQQFLAILTRTNQLGQARKFTFLGPQRTLGQFAINIVQVTQYQREGGGTASTQMVVEDVLKLAGGGEVSWVYDDTLIGKGVGGSDAVIMIMPEVEQQPARKLNTNTFADLGPGVGINAVMYSSGAAPIEIPCPLPGGAIDVLSEWRISSGWVTRPECVTILSLPYQ